MCTYFLKIENCAKSDFRNYPNYSKDKHTEILEFIILRNLTKIDIVFQHVGSDLLVSGHQGLYESPFRTYSKLLN